MRRGYARLPRLVARSPSRASSSSSFALSPLSHLSDSESDSDDDDVDVWGSVAASGKAGAPTRLRLGALRLWSRARDVTSRSGGDEVEACRTLVREQGLAPLLPRAAPFSTRAVGGGDAATTKKRSARLLRARRERRRDGRRRPGDRRGRQLGHTIRRKRPYVESWRGRRSTARRCSAGWTTRGWPYRGGAAPC